MSNTAQSVVESRMEIQQRHQFTTKAGKRDVSVSKLSFLVNINSVFSLLNIHLKDGRTTVTWPNLSSCLLDVGTE